MSNIIGLNNNHPLVGKWQATDGFSDVIVSIEPKNNSFIVNVVDESDGEVAEVYETNFDGDALRFNVHWLGNGRFIKYRFLLTDKNTIDVTYTYSSQETWQKI